MKIARARRAIVCTTARGCAIGQRKIEYSCDSGGIAERKNEVGKARAHIGDRHIRNRKRRRVIFTAAGAGAVVHNRADAQIICNRGIGRVAQIDSESFCAFEDRYPCFIENSYRNRLRRNPRRKA